MEKDHHIVGRVEAAKGNPTVADILIADYMPFIKAETYKSLGRIPIEGRDDELSIAMFAFYEAIETYSKLKGAFLSYAALLIRRKLIDYHRKERRHMGQISLDTPLSEEGDTSLGDKLPDTTDALGEGVERSATVDEINELTLQLQGFGLALSDIADNCPQQERTLAACAEVLRCARENPELIGELKQTGKLPLARLTAGSGVERKTIERHRKYIMALLIIYSNGYEIIRGHLTQVLSRSRGGTGV